MPTPARRLLDFASHGAMLAATAMNPNDASVVADLVTWHRPLGIADADGVAIDTWTNTVGGFNLTGATTTRALAKTGANGINGLAVARFDGTDDIMSTSNTVWSVHNAAPFNMTFFVVFRPQSLAATGGLVGYNATSGLHYQWELFVTTAGKLQLQCWQDGGAQNGVVNGTPTFLNQTPNVAVVRMAENTTYDVWTNGGVKDTTSSITGSMGTSGLGISTIGKRADNSGPFNGDIAEVFCYRALLSTANIDKLLKYCETTYALQGRLTNAT